MSKLIGQINLLPRDQETEIFLSISKKLNQFKDNLIEYLY